MIQRLGLDTDFWKPLRPHPVQQALWKCTNRYVAVVAGRGSGKSLLAKRKVALSLAIRKDWSDPKYAYCLPTRNQALKVAWYDFLRLIPQSWIKGEPNKSEGTITTVFGSVLYIVGMDKPHRLEGFQLDGVVVDESSDQRPGMFNKSLVPMLSHRNAWAWRIGVPKKSGIGRTEFREFFKKGIAGESEYASFSWKSSEILTPEQIEIAKAQMGLEEYREQYDAEWVDSGGGIYYAFSKHNVSEDAVYDPSQLIIVGCDFNVDPMCWVLCHLKDGKLIVFDELFIKNTNTPATLKFLREKYAAHTQGFAFCGDAAARQRKTATAKTDYLLIKNDSSFPDKKVFFPDKNPQLKDRFASVNAALCNAKGERRVLINPKCKRLLLDFESCSYEEGTTIPENYDGTDTGHMVDAFGYTVMRYMPMKLDSNTKGVVILR